MDKKDKINFFLGSILENIEAIENYIRDFDHKSFMESSLVQDAVAKKLENIGEAVRAIPDDFKEKNDHIPWQDVADMRNFLIHKYFGIDAEEVWRTIKNDIPDFKTEISRLVNRKP